MQTVVLISPTNSIPIPSQRQKHGHWEWKELLMANWSLACDPPSRLREQVTSGRTPWATAREYCPVLKISKLSI